jgi:molybdopterin-guanine dinucleotide biosynthesis protein A
VANRLTGVLLVGGRSRRFGSPKALAEFRGETLAERGWRILGEACDERLPVGKSGDALPLPFPVLDDATALRHPAAGMIVGLEAAKHDVVVFLPVDCPAVAAADLRALGEACVDAAVPAEGDPLPAAFRKSALPALRRRLESQGSLRGILDELDVRRVSLDRIRLADADTPEELRRIERSSRALDAASAVAAAQGLDASEARILSDWNDTVVHLAPEPVVARVRTSWVTRFEPAALTYAREIAVARFAAARGAPVVPPLRVAGPFERDGLAVALWEHVVELPGEHSEREAALALRALHDALDDYDGELPELDERLDRAADVIASPDSVPALGEHDRAFLEERLRDLRGRLDARPARRRALHGGAHAANLLRTPDGPRWIDFDTASRGPVEFDVAHLGPDAAPLFPEADADRLALTRQLVSAEVAIWCWHTFGRAPEVDEAARHHLDLLRG